jgi:hypothetical protein
VLPRQGGGGGGATRAYIARAPKLARVTPMAVPAMGPRPRPRPRRILVRDGGGTARRHVRCRGSACAPGGYVVFRTGAAAAGQLRVCWPGRLLVFRMAVARSTCSSSGRQRVRHFRASQWRAETGPSLYHTFRLCRWTVMTTEPPTCHWALPRRQRSCCVVFVYVRE